MRCLSILQSMGTATLHHAIGHIWRGTMPFKPHANMTKKNLLT